MTDQSSGTFLRTKRSPTNFWRPFMEVIGRGKPSYMIRVHLTPFGWWKWRRAYLHILGRPDDDREYHDHPWSFWTIVLFGGYTETSHIMTRGFKQVSARPTGTFREDRIGWLGVRYRPATHAHLITRLHTRRVVTLVLRDNTKARDWGFWKQDDTGRWSWIPWREYHGVNP